MCYHKPIGKSNKTPAFAGKEKETALSSLSIMRLKSNGSCNLTGAKAASASVNSLGSSVDNCLNSLYVGLPGSVGTSVRMGNLNAEGHIFTAEIAFCHVSHLLVTH